MEKENKVEITLKGAGLVYKGDINEELAGQIMSLCLSGQNTPINENSLIMPTYKAVPSKESAAEYVNRHAPKRNPDKILTLAGFLRESHHKDFFQPGEIKNLFRDAGEILPANFNRDFKWVVSSGWIAPDTLKKGNFYITSTGSKVLAAGFPEELVKRTKSRGNVRRKKYKKKD